MTNNKVLLPQEIYQAKLETINEVKFSQREIDVIACVLQMRTTKKMASVLSISPKTVESHIRSITQKLECGSREGIVDFVEKSDQYLEIKNYYSHLLVLKAFEERLKEIAKHNLNKNLACLKIHVGKNTSPYLVAMLKKHFDLFGLKDVSISLGPPISSTTELKEFINPKGDANYYRAFFSFAEGLFPEFDIGIYRSDFEKQCKRLLDPYTPLSQYEKSDRGEDQETRKEENVRSILGWLYINKKWSLHVILVILFGLGGSAYYILKVPYGPVVARSDLNIPSELILLTRSKLLNEIDHKLTSQNEIQNIAIIGIGGSGKTTLARQYAGIQNAPVVWEINAETAETLKNSFENLAYSLATSEADIKILLGIQDIKDSLKREQKNLSFVKEKLRNQSHWVLIFDNVEKFSDLQKYYPSDPLSWGTGKVILTAKDTHLRQNNHIKASLFIEELTPQEKFDLFTKINAPQKDKSLTKEQREEITRFLEKLPPFPLDISIAAYYLNATNIPYKDYLNRLSKGNRTFISTQESLLKEASDYTKTRGQIIITSLQHLIEAHKDFAGLMLFISLIDSQNIPRDLLSFYKNSAVVDHFIFFLKKYSLITGENFSLSLGSAFSIHRSTQQISLDYLTKFLEPEKLDAARNIIIEAFERHFERVINLEKFSKMTQIKNHLETFLKHDKLLTPTTRAALTSELGCIYYYACFYDDALQLLRRSLNDLQENPKRNEVRKARVLSHLGKVYRELGNREAAEALFKKSILIYKDHSLVSLEFARTLGYLGDTYRNIGAFDRAEYYLTKGLKIYQNQSGSPVWIAWMLGYLGNVYLEIGAYEKAQEKFEHSLMLFKRTGNARRISWVLGKLGQVYYELGHYEKAKNLIDESLLDYKKIFSEKHSYVVWAQRYLGNIHGKLGNNEKAKILQEKSLKNHIRLFGKTNIITLGVYADLGKAHLELGETSKAIKCIKKTLTAYEKHYGENHLKTARVLGSIGRAYILNADLETAEPLMLKALEIFQKNKHPDAYSSFEDLSALCKFKEIQAENNNDIQQVEMLKAQSIDHLKQALKIVRAHFPKDSPHILRIESKIENNLRNQND